jgi:hypothetical protein
MRNSFTLALMTALLALGMPAAGSATLSPGQFKNASKFCKALRAEMGDAAFAEAFGTNHNKRNAFGKCVSKKGVLPEPPAAPLTPCPVGEPPLPVSAFVVDPSCTKPPLPVSTTGTAPADDGGKHGPKPKKSK